MSLSNTINYHDNNIPNGDYFYYVVANYSSDNSEPSNTVEVVIEVLYPITTLSAIIQNNNNVYLNWINPTDGSRNLLSYLIFRNGVEIEEIIDANIDFYLDAELENGDYEYYIIASYDSGNAEQSNTEQITISVDNDEIIVTKLIGNYPNPFNPNTTIDFFVIENDMEKKISISICNSKGQKVISIPVDLELDNTVSVRWNGKNSTGNDVSSGVYFYMLNINGKSVDTKRMILIK